MSKKNLKKSIFKRNFSLNTNLALFCGFFLNIYQDFQTQMKIALMGQFRALAFCGD